MKAPRAEAKRSSADILKTLMSLRRLFTYVTPSGRYWIGTRRSLSIIKKGSFVVEAIDEVIEGILPSSVQQFLLPRLSDLKREYQERRL